MQHQDLNSRWQTWPLSMQLGNVGAEVRRMFVWRTKNDTEQVVRARDRALELMDLTIADCRWQRGRRELVRLREVVAAEGTEGQSLGISKEALNKYFTQFALVARK